MGDAFPERSGVGKRAVVGCWKLLGRQWDADKRITVILGDEIDCDASVAQERRNGYIATECFYSNGETWGIGVLICVCWSACSHL
jgi:hypothetical protein